jgi:AcrR family transcriptional regulator
VTLTEGTAAPKQDRSQDKLNRLLLAGRELFEERGIEGTRVSDIAARAGCSVGVFYQRFADKDALLIAVRDKFLAAVSADATAIDAAAGPDQPLAALLSAHVERAVRLMRHNADLLRAFLVYELSHPEFDQPLQHLTEQTAHRLVEAAERTGVRIRHQDPAMALTLSAHLVRGLLVEEIVHRTRPHRLSDAALARELSAVLVLYLTGETTV